MKNINTGSKDTRSGFGAGMTELGQKNENVVALCADLIGSLKFDDFKKITQSVFSKSGSKHDWNCSWINHWR
jgi:transketolase C-terminal domain/subunit